MKPKAFYSAAAVVLAAGLATGSSVFAVTGPRGIEVGDLGSINNYNKQITITPKTKAVNVTQGDMVKFVDQQTGQSFVWIFDTPGAEHFDLSAVAPAGVLAGRHIEAYVSEDRRSES
jgi:hypothetical protein